MVWEENSRICLHMQLIAILSRTGVRLTGGSNKKRIGGFGIAPGTAFWVML